MIDFESARKMVLSNTGISGTQVLKITEAHGYILAEDVKAEDPLPRFDSSAVDGFGVKYADLDKANPSEPVSLKLSGIVRAGDAHDPELENGYAIKIMTGAPVPGSVEAIVMREFVDEGDDTVRVKRNVRQGENIRRSGEEFSRGDIVLKSGTVLTPGAIGMLATLNRTRVTVYRKPAVALIVTGSETRLPGGEIGTGQIPESNSFALSAALRAIGISQITITHTNDDKTEISAAFKDALDYADIVISSGGVSVGDYDFVKDVLTDLGVRTVFWKVAMKPAKPFYFGMHSEKMIFGLPGNPVSALLSFYLLVKPALNKLSGLDAPNRIMIKAGLLSELRKKPGRKEFVRAKLIHKEDGNFFVQPSRGQDSHMMGGLAAADCLIHFPEQADFLEKDKRVDVEILQWGNL